MGSSKAGPSRRPDASGGTLDYRNNAHLVLRPTDDLEGNPGSESQKYAKNRARISSVVNSCKDPER